MSGTEGDIYIFVAITRLSDSTGMFALFGRHEEDQSEDQSKETERILNLEVGDAVVWTANTQGRNSSGEGGLSIIMVYR